MLQPEASSIACLWAGAAAAANPPLTSPSPPQYVFSFSYDDDGNVHMTAGGSSKQRFSTKDNKVGAGAGGRLVGQCGSATALRSASTAQPHLPSLCLWRNPPPPAPLLACPPAPGPHAGRRQVPGGAPHADAGGDHQHAREGALP